jgi:hypothetical protein
MYRRYHLRSNPVLVLSMMSLDIINDMPVTLGRNPRTPPASPHLLSAHFMTFSPPSSTSLGWIQGQQ